jgi:exoribonuclease-2
MEKYWCLRWIQQENRTRMSATVLKEGMVRFDEIPLLTRVPELAQAARGTQVMLEIMGSDEIGLDLSVRVLELCAGGDAAALDSAALDELEQEMAEGDPLAAEDIETPEEAPEARVGVTDAPSDTTPDAAPDTSGEPDETAPPAL